MCLVELLVIQSGGGLCKDIDPVCAIVRAAIMK